MVEEQIEGELRASKGVLLFNPKGSSRLLRVELPGLEVDFKAKAVTLTLKQTAKGIVVMPKLEPAIDPPNGVPYRVIGQVVAVDDSGVLVATVDGISIRLELQRPAQIPLKSRVLAELTGSLRASLVAAH